MLKIILGLFLLLMAMWVLSMVPDIIRYMKMRSM